MVSLYNAAAVMNSSLLLECSHFDVLAVVEFRYLYSPGSGAEYCDERVSVSVCLSVCLSLESRNSETTRPNFIKFSEHVVTPACMWPWLGPAKAALQYVTYKFPVLWMTSRFPTTGFMAALCYSNQHYYSVVHPN